MKTSHILLVALLVCSFCCCNNTGSEEDKQERPVRIIYVLEPADSASYKHLKYTFYANKNGELCERKIAMGRNVAEMEVYYDPYMTIYAVDSDFQKPLASIIDINSFEWAGTSQYSKDKNQVYYFFNNSDGGLRWIVKEADPLSFKPFGDSRWGMDKKAVFFEGELLKYLNPSKLQLLYFPDTSEHFLEYVKDDRLVFWEYKVITGADASSFKAVSGKDWDAEDKNNRYKFGAVLK